LERLVSETRERASILDDYAICVSCFPRQNFLRVEDFAVDRKHLSRYEARVAMTVGMRKDDFFTNEFPDALMGWFGDMENFFSASREFFQDDRDNGSFSCAVDRLNENMHISVCDK
jgi:hypothetical protein